jgi:hypothetical protein
MTYKSLTMQRACRAHLLNTADIAVCAGKPVIATSTGYTKSSGAHFLDEGFAVGMQVNVTGFATAANNGIKLVTAVSQTALTVQGGATPEGANGPRTIRAIIPTLQVWENINATPVEGTPWITERWLGGPSTLITTTRDGFVENTPQYQIVLFTPSGLGMECAAAYADGILHHFRPGTAITDAGGNVARVRGDTGPFRAALTLDTPGWSALSLTIPLRVESRNT